MRDDTQIAEAWTDALGRLEKVLVKLPHWTPVWVFNVVGFAIFLGVLGMMIEDVCCEVGSPWA